MIPQSEKIQKLLLLYITKHYEFPLTEEQFIKVVIDNDFMDYLSFKTNLLDLLKTEQIKKELLGELKVYKITEDGDFTLEQFMHLLPDSPIETFNTYMKNNLHQIKSDTLLNSTYKFLPDGQIEVDCFIREKDTPLLAMKVYIGDKHTAQAICDNWETASPAIYKIIMDTLLR